MKKQRLEQLTNEMIEILMIDLQEENATEESQTIKFKHYNKDLIAKAFAAAKPKYSLEWSADIIRDEVYATVYESMEIIAANMDIEEISLDNSEFAGPVYNMTMLKLKEHLIPRSKRERTGEVIGMQVMAASQLGLNNNGQALTIEDILEGTDTYILMGAAEEKMNHFLKWFEANKSKILTKNQLKFLSNDEIKEKSNAAHTRKRIAERVSRAYNEQYGDVSPRIAILKDQERILEEILDAKSFRAAYDKYKDEDFIIDAISEYVALEYLRAFNKGNNNPETIRAMRIALYKRLGEVINMIEAAK